MQGKWDTMFGKLAALLVVSSLLAWPFLSAAQELGVVYSCMSKGVRHYVSKPIAGAECQRIAYRSQPVPVSSVPSQFKGYHCTQDCSGHRAGYEWAQRKGITNAEQCGGNSPSFIEGCRAFAEGQ